MRKRLAIVIIAGVPLAIAAVLTADVRWRFDEVPSFVDHVPDLPVSANDSILRVTITRYLTSSECLNSMKPPHPEDSLQTSPTPFALAKVDAVLKGTYDGNTIMVCNPHTSTNFKIGEAGIVLGLLGQGRNEIGRIQPFETTGRWLKREQLEGYLCLWTWCTGPMFEPWRPPGLVKAQHQ